MKGIEMKNLIGFLGISIFIASCMSIAPVQKTEKEDMPEAYQQSKDTLNSAQLNWKDYFTDTNLMVLIDSALSNNQELNIILQEMNISQNEIKARKGEYLPFVNFRGGAETEKPGRFTSKGSSEATTEIEPGRETPDPLPDYMIGAHAQWEVDIWKKLRNAKKAAVLRYLSSIEGKNFMVTSLIAEIANSYYELIALDNQLEIVNQNIEIQSNALKIVRKEKDAAKVTELAVQKFEAEVYNTRSLQFDIRQKIVETENRINFLTGRFPQPVQRNSAAFYDLLPDTVYSGIPSQLLSNRPDIKKSEFELEASKLDVKVARARFYPSLDLSADIGLQAFDPAYLIKTPESMLYSLAGDITAPLINRNAIKAAYRSANSQQIQAVLNYEQTLLMAYIEVVNQLSMISNLEKSYDLKQKQVRALTRSIKISNDLFLSARADYMEVLMTQRDALESKFELVETRKKQLNATVKLYQALGGGWK